MLMVVSKVSIRSTPHLLSFPSITQDVYTATLFVCFTKSNCIHNCTGDKHCETYDEHGCLRVSVFMFPAQLDQTVEHLLPGSTSLKDKVEIVKLGNDCVTVHIFLAFPKGGPLEPLKVSLPMLLL